MSESTPVNRKLLIALGAIIVLALVFVFVVNPLLSGDDTAAQVDPAVAAAGVTPTPEPTEEPTTEPVEESFEVFSARDPFEQLVEADVAAAPANGEPTVAGGPAATSTDPVTDPSEAAAQVNGTTVELVDVYDDAGTDTVQVTVNGTGYEVTAGDTFADRLEVLEINGQCATFQFDDKRFVLCKGEHIRK